MDGAIVTVEAAELVAAGAARPSQNPARVYLARLAPGSRAMVGYRLTVLAATAQSLEVPDNAADQEAMRDAMPWAALRYEHTQAIRARLGELYDAPTVNAALSALRQVLKDAWRLGQMTAEEYMRAADVANVKGEKPDQAAGRALSLGELMALAAACNDGTPSGARDSAMLAVAYACGLRRAEIVGLDLEDYRGDVLTVKGKRNKVRTVPIQNGARQALADWLQLRGNEPGPIFTPIGKGGRMTIRRMTTQAVYYAFAARADQANVKTFSPHDLRRTFAGDLLDAGADISTVQKMMGHANVQTTAGYDRRGERAKVDAAKRLHFPYQGKR